MAHAGIHCQHNSVRIDFRRFIGKPPKEIMGCKLLLHDDVIKWKRFPRYWPFVRGIHRSPMNSPHKGQWCGASMFSFICPRTNVWVNNWDAGDLTRHSAHYRVTFMPRGHHQRQSWHHDNSRLSVFILISILWLPGSRYRAPPHLYYLNGSRWLSLPTQ